MEILQYKIGHDIVAAYKEFKGYVSILDLNDLRVIEKINKFYVQKGLEYFTLDVMVALVNSGKDLPTVEEIQLVSTKINRYLVGNKFFINA